MKPKTNPKQDVSFPGDKRVPLDHRELNWAYAQTVELLNALVQLMASGKAGQVILDAKKRKGSDGLFGWPPPRGIEPLQARAAGDVRRAMIRLQRALREARETIGPLWHALTHAVGHVARWRPLAAGSVATERAGFHALTYGVALEAFEHCLPFAGQKQIDAVLFRKLDPLSIDLTFDEACWAPLVQRIQRIADWDLHSLHQEVKAERDHLEYLLEVESGRIAGPTAGKQDHDRAAQGDVRKPQPSRWRGDWISHTVAAWIVKYKSGQSGSIASGDTFRKAVLAAPANDPLAELRDTTNRHAKSENGRLRREAVDWVASRRGFDVEARYKELENDRAAPRSVRKRGKTRNKHTANSE